MSLLSGGGLFVVAVCCYSSCAEPFVSLFAWGRLCCCYILWGFNRRLPMMSLWSSWVQLFLVFRIFLVVYVPLSLTNRRKVNSWYYCDWVPLYLLVSHELLYMHDTQGCDSAMSIWTITTHSLNGRPEFLSYLPSCGPAYSSPVVLVASCYSQKDWWGEHTMYSMTTLLVLHLNAVVNQEWFRLWQ